MERGLGIHGVETQTTGTGPGVSVRTSAEVFPNKLQVLVVASLLAERLGQAHLPTHALRELVLPVSGRNRSLFPCHSVTVLNTSPQELQYFYSKNCWLDWQSLPRLLRPSSESLIESVADEPACVLCS